MPKNQKLLDYLESVMKLEVDRYICEKSIEKNKGHLEDAKQITEKELSKLEPTRPSKRYSSSKYPEKVEKPGVGEFMIKLVTTIMVMYSLFLWIIMMTDNKLLVINILFIISIIITICIYSVLCSDYKDYLSKCKEIDKEEKRVREEYEQAIKLYEKKYEQYKTEKAKLEQQQQAHIEPIEKANRELKATLRRINAALEEAYASDIIHEDYRALIPVSMFVSYIEKERCYALEGVDGAYNKYEEELRMNLIVNRLDTIASKLDDIQGSMGTLYRAMISANSLIEQLGSKVDNQIAIQEFNGRVIADRSQALLSIEQDRLYEAQRLNREVIGY